MKIRHRRFRDHIDRLEEVQMCHVCQESYVRIQVFKTNTNTVCIWCKRERTNQRFSVGNHIDPRTQPHVLGVLTQVEEMLIACASPILQVMHSIGGQYKYWGHVINFLQEVKYVAKTLPTY